MIQIAYIKFPKLICIRPICKIKQQNFLFCFVINLFCVNGVKFRDTKKCLY